MKRTLPVFLFAILVAVFIGGVPNVHAFSSYFSSQGCSVCHVGQTGSNYCGMCHAHGVHSSSAKNDINVTGTTNKSLYAPGETVSVTVSGGYRPSQARAILYDQNMVLLDISTGTGTIPINAPLWPVTLSAPAPTTPGTYTWSVAWYGNQYDLTEAGSGTTFFGPGWTPDPGNANHGWETVSIASFDVVSVGAPQIEVNPASHNFGNVPVGNSAIQEFSISNTGAADLHISAGILSDETNFAVDGNSGSSPCGELPVTITPNDLCTVLITFSPHMEVLYTATVTVSSDDPVNPSLVVDLSGNGVTGPAPNLVVTPASVDFGQVNVGDTPAEEVTLYNTGTDNLVVSGIALDNAAVYSLDETGGANPCGSLTPTIVAGDNCTVDVVFSPLADGGPFTATVTITSNVPNVDVPLTGTGFLDSDGDGVGDSVDDFPNDASKATPQSATGTGKITVDAGTNALSVVSAVAVDPGQTVPSGFTFPDGLVTFQVAVAAPGDNAVVTVTFPSGQPFGSTYFKADGSAAFVEFTGATINTDNVVLMLTDGGSGDNDNTADGVIIDPGGLATPVPSSPGGGGGGSCSVIGSGGNGGGGALLFLTMLAILVTLRLKVARARR